MSYTDPSGYFFVAHKSQQTFIKAAVKVFGVQVVGVAGNLATIGCGVAAPVCAAHFNYNFSRAMGVSTSGALRSAFTAAASAYAFQQIGGVQNISDIQRIGLHAYTGGVISVLQGGIVGHGFWSAGLTKAANVNGIIGTDQGLDCTYLRVATAAVIGGTISKLTGGKFANGATTAAFAQAFNGEEEAEYKDKLATFQKEMFDDANGKRKEIYN